MLTLLIALNACHWIGDFTHASRPWMLAAKKSGRPLLPIAAHAGVHAVPMTLVGMALVGLESGLLIGAIQWPAHFAIDVAKGRSSALSPELQNPASYWYWWVFGADQYLHQLVMIGTVAIVYQ